MTTGVERGPRGPQGEKGEPGPPSVPLPQGPRSHWPSLLAALFLVAAFALAQANLYRIDADRAAGNRQLIDANKVILNRVVSNEGDLCVFEREVYSRRQFLDRVITRPVQIAKADQVRFGLTDEELKTANAALAARNAAFASELQLLLSTLKTPAC